jgi:high-affinity nickel permease
MALLVGSIEWLQVTSSQLACKGGFFKFLNNLDFAIVGAFVVGFMLFIWFLAYLYYKKVLKEQRMNLPQ